MVEATGALRVWMGVLQHTKHTPGYATDACCIPQVLIAMQLAKTRKKNTVVSTSRAILYLDYP